jgi:putative ABC transport system permease protein
MTIEIVQQNLWYAWRHLRRKPSFCAVVIVTLALGIGANTAIFSLIYALLLHPFPYKNPEQLVRLQSASTRTGQPNVDVSIPDLEDYRSANRTLADIGIFSPRTIDLLDGNVAQTTTVTLTTSGAFNALGTAPVIGRTFVEQEDLPGGDVYKAILSFEFWKTRYGADRNILGRQIRTAMATYSVIGVMPQGYGYPGRTEMWVPLQSYLKNSNKDWIKQRGSRMYPAIGRLRPGVTMAQAQADLDSISKRLARDYPNTNKEFRLEPRSLRDAEVGSIRPYLLLLLAATALVLIVCTANIANLTLAMSADRARETVIRTALGASGPRLLSLFLTESVVLSFLGGLFGLLLAFCGVRLFPRMIPTELPSWVSLEVNWAVLLFNVLASVAAGISFGMAPSFYGLQTNLTDVLRQGVRATGQSGWLRKVLIMGEVAICFTLLVGAGLLVKNFDRLRRVDPGFPSEHLLTFKLSPYQPGKNNEAIRRYASFYDRVIQRLEMVPGVIAAGATNAFPFENATLRRDQATIGVKGESEQARIARGASILADVTPEYFRAMGIPLLEGRVFNEADIHDKQMAVIVSQRTARLLFPNRPAVGQSLRIVYLDAADPWGVVVGVVGDVKYTATEDAQGLELYYPNTQYPLSSGRVAVRFQGDPSRMTESVRLAMAEAAPDTAVSDVRLMDQMIMDTLWQQKLWGFLLAAFSGLALLLAALGIYGVISHIVKQRTFEFGIRMALGADRKTILAMVTMETFRIVAIGLAIGFGLSLFLTRSIRSLLFAVSSSDPAVLISVPVLIAMVALLASLLPAYRALSVQPWQTLRNE